MQFLHDVIGQLLAASLPIPLTVGLNDVADDIVRLKDRHFISNIPTTTNSNKLPSKDCQVCRARHKD